MASRPRPPPVPWFRGRTVVLTETPDGKLCIKPIAPHAFSEPPGTFELYLRADRLVVAVAEGAALGFQGDFYESRPPTDVVLAPVDPDDAQQIERVLAARLGLPRAPRSIDAAELGRLREWAFVIVEGLYRSAHEEMADFEGVQLDAANLEQNRRYRVVGYLTPSEFDPEDQFAETGPGYNGAILRAVTITPLGQLRPTSDDR